MTSLVLAAVDSKLVISTVAYIIPWILVVAMVIVGIVAYIKKSGLTTNSVLSIARALFDNADIRHWFDQEVQQAIELVAKSIAKQSDQKFSGSYDAVVKYVNAALLALMQTAKTAIDNAAPAEEIYDILNRYKIDVDNVEQVSSYIIEILGYTEEEIKWRIKEEVEKLTKK